MERAHQFAQKAVELDPNLPQARAQLGLVLVWRRQNDASIASFERAIALNPHFSDWRFAAALALAGEPGGHSKCWKHIFESIRSIRRQHCTTWGSSLHAQKVF